MSAKKVGSGHSNEVALARLDRQARNAARRKKWTPPDAGTRQPPNSPVIHRGNAVPGLPLAKGDPFTTQGQGEWGGN